jgi:hypothetical protein
MEYRGIEYTLVQGIKPGVWKWTTSAANLLIMGKAPSRPAAVAAVERAINKALLRQQRCVLSRADLATDGGGRHDIGTINVEAWMYRFGRVAPRRDPGLYFCAGTIPCSSA